MAEDDDTKDYVASFSEALTREISRYGKIILFLLIGIFLTLIFIAGLISQKGI